jgi:hypothetical protein
MESDVYIDDVIDDDEDVSYGHEAYALDSGDGDVADVAATSEREWLEITRSDACQRATNALRHLIRAEAERDRPMRCRVADFVAFFVADAWPRWLRPSDVLESVDDVDDFLGHCATGEATAWAQALVAVATHLHRLTDADVMPTRLERIATHAAATGEEVSAAIRAATHAAKKRAKRFRDRERAKGRATPMWGDGSGEPAGAGAGAPTDVGPEVATPARSTSPASGSDTRPPQAAQATRADEGEMPPSGKPAYAGGPRGPAGEGSSDKNTASTSPSATVLPPIHPRGNDGGAVGQTESGANGNGETPPSGKPAYAGGPRGPAGEGSFDQNTASTSSSAMASANTTSRGTSEASTSQAVGKDVDEVERGRGTEETDLPLAPPDVGVQSVRRLQLSHGTSSRPIS